MAKMVTAARVELEIVVTLSESEAMALLALASCGIDVLLRAFYEQPGEGHLKTHEAGLRSLFEGARRELPALFKQADNARMAFNGWPVPGSSGRRLEPSAVAVDGAAGNPDRPCGLAPDVRG